MQRMKFIGPALALCALPALAHADRFALEYQGNAWALAPLGGATLDVTTTPTDYRIQATLRSGGLLRLFDRSELVADAQGAIVDETPVWTRYDLDHSYAKKRRVTSMRASPEALNVTITPTYRLWGEPPASDAQKREARDPLSLLVAMGMAAGKTRTCAGSFATFDGRFRYDLVMSGGKTANYEAGGYDGPVLRCTLQYVQVAGYEKKKNERQKIPQGEIWFALLDDSTFAPPVRVLLPLPIGQAGISLKKWQRARVDVLADETVVEPAAPPTP